MGTPLPPEPNHLIKSDTYGLIKYGFVTRYVWRKHYGSSATLSVNVARIQPNSNAPVQTPLLS
jgi:hypothetical protein